MADDKIATAAYQGRASVVTTYDRERKRLNLVLTDVDFEDDEGQGINHMKAKDLYVEISIVRRKLGGA